MGILEQHQNKIYQFRLNGKQYIAYVKRYDKALNQLIWKSSAPFDELTGFPSDVPLDMEMAFSPPELFESAEIIKTWQRPTGTLRQDEEGNEWFDGYMITTIIQDSESPKIYIYTGEG
jgi:hypothetical protein